ncbi:N-acyl-L-amino acid amidohydrolase [Brevibacillus reuszeri]|uniref:N-acyl-L-amino acid amidohydrolase n=1 Tax=Brevibacillus reuszeri TaxID=54915 RepID=A0A0K9YT41_9BACL|nr:amidohydrolase [Brevibacillus reuszeri]KNB71355.1 N-acyl-L-amino acid amidohydrolase [Brevibacillus reuszeri]MED1857802.1 amidohydrolase [Brevibacillus reuszeri]GED66366.1 N-acyl-L-amino acid amidohydrolase [Brevibacillus reuszeri]
MSWNAEKLAAEVAEQVVAWRRYLHQHPELSFQEDKTSQYVYETLESFGNLELSRPTKTSIVARLIGSEPGKVLGIRADIDALPIHEENEVPYASSKPGVMHACGHDGHTAMLLGAAKILSGYKDKIKGEVRFIFQHAEELPPGGAAEIVRSGAADGMDSIIGIHLASYLPVGKFGVLYGALTSSTDRFDITIQGKGGHSSQPEMTVDPIVIGASVISHLQQIVSRNVSALDKVVISVTMLNAGTAYNIIPDTLTITGSTRCFDEEIRKNIPIWIEKIVKGITDAHGASYEFTYSLGYTSVVNDQNVTKLMEDTIRERWGDEDIVFIDPVMPGEDFSEYLKKAPGCFIQLGAGNPEKGFTYPHHHPRFDFDEDCLVRGVELFIRAAEKVVME